MTSDLIRIAIPNDGELATGSARLLGAVGLPFSPGQPVTKRDPPPGLGRAGIVMLLPPADIQAAVQNGTCDYGIVAPTFETPLIRTQAEFLLAPNEGATSQDTFLLAQGWQEATAFLIGSERPLPPAKEQAAAQFLAACRDVCHLYSKQSAQPERPAAVRRPLAASAAELAV